MRDETKTKQQLIQELSELRKQKAKLEKSKAKQKQAEDALVQTKEEAGRLAQENALLAEIGRIISSSPNIDEVFELFSKAVTKLIPCDRIVVNIINLQRDASSIRYVGGMDIPGRRAGENIPLTGTAISEVIRTKSSLLIQPKDAKEIEEVVGKFPKLLTNFTVGIRSIIMVPLVAEDRIIGVLNLRTTRPQAYSDQDVRLARSIASQIAGAVANARLYADRREAEEALRRSEGEARRLVEESALVAEIGRIIGSTPNIDEVFERFSRAVAKLIPFDRVQINLNNPQKDASLVRYVAGIDVPRRRAGEYVALASTASGECTRSKASLLLQPEDDQEIEEVLRRFSGLLPNFETGIRSILMVPLIAEDQAIGVLTFRSLKTKAYTDQTVKLAESIASQIAGAVANAQLYAERRQAEEALRKSEEEARKLAQENELVAEIGKIISSTLDIKEVYERFAGEMRKLIPFERMAMNVIDAKSQMFAIPYVSGGQIKDREEGKILPLAGTGTERILRTRKSIFIDEENREAILREAPGLLRVIEAGFQSVIMVPLISKNEVIGTLNLQLTQPGGYTEDDLRLAERISSQIAGAVANSLLYEEHQRAEEALRQSEERYRNILTTIEDGFYEVDAAGNLTFFNDALCRILGYSPDEMVGMNNRQYMDPENAKKAYQFFKTLCRTGETVRGWEWEIIRKDGTKRSTEASAHLLRDAEGKQIGFRGIVRDISERKQAERAMAEIQEQLRQSQKIEAIGQLAGGIAHDFNNSLTLIKTSAQLALLELKAGDPLRQTFELINKATEQSANLTRQLLAFSRRQIMELQVVDLNSLLQDMDKMLHRVIGEDIELVSVLAKDLWRTKVDPGQMEQVILNFVLNARDAMPTGGKLTIQTANVELDGKYVQSHLGVKAGRYIQIAVSDTGTGMAPEVRDRVFEPFFTTKEKGKGTGLGLSTVYGIVKQSGGNIWVYSEWGKGTTFKVYLPRVDDPLKEEKKKLLQPERGLPRGAETVLVTEDEGEVRNLVGQILRNQGYDVLEAANGGEALMICERHRGVIDLLMTDVVMPVMSGRELADRLLVLHPEMKVLYMSGYTDDAIVRHGILDEGVHFIPKPFSVENLALKVREVLDQ